MDENNYLLRPYIYINNKPGKNIRSIFIDALNYWLKVPTSEINIIKDIINKLHNASLLIDDIEDNSLLRRGVPVAHNIYGIPETINSANYIYFKVLDTIYTTNNKEALKVYITEMLELHRGQGMDIYWR